MPDYEFDIVLRVRIVAQNKADARRAVRGDAATLKDVARPEAIGTLATTTRATVRDA